jgi:hypothetical protein
MIFKELKKKFQKQLSKLVELHFKENYLKKFSTSLFYFIIIFIVTELRF